MLLLFPLFFQSNFFYAFEFGGVNGSLFTVRSRGLNSALYWGSQMLGSYLIGAWLLDSIKLGNARRRGSIGFILTNIVTLITWIMAIILMYAYEGGYDKGTGLPGGLIDLNQGSRYVFPVITYVLMGIADAMLQSLAYWIMAAIAGPDTSLAARYTGYYKGVQSLGGAISWLIDRPTVGYRVQMWINIGLFAVSILPAVMAIREIPLEHPDKGAPKETEIEDIEKTNQVTWK